MIASDVSAKIPLSTGHWASEALRPTQHLVEDSGIGCRQEGTLSSSQTWNLKVARRISSLTPGKSDAFHPASKFLEFPLLGIKME